MDELDFEARLTELIGWPCLDCGCETAPRSGGKAEAGTQETYTVHDELWRSVGLDADAFEEDLNGEYLCIGCLEARLGRQLRPEDFISAPINRPSDLHTPRLASRRRGA